MTDSIFLHQQIPTDYRCLDNVSGCLPCNVDGLTERCGYFLLFEIKSGEILSGGQTRMLKRLAALQRWTVLVINCPFRNPNEKGGRDFVPATFFVMDNEGNLDREYVTNPKSFALRYDAWLRMPEDGSTPFTCSVAEFQKRYAFRLPGDLPARALALVKQPDEAHE
jgi:hypothetical protein